MKLFDDILIICFSYIWNSEKELFAHYLTKNLSEESQRKLKDYEEKLQRALESKEFLERL